MTRKRKRRSSVVEIGNGPARVKIYTVHCKDTLAAAIDEWASARRAAGQIAISDAVRFYQANRKDLLITRTLAQVAEEFIESRRAGGNSEIHVRNCGDYHHWLSLLSHRRCNGATG